MNPTLQVLLTFWQPRSAEHLEPEYWLRAEQIDGTEQYILRDDRMEEWADELVSRVTVLPQPWYQRDGYRRTK